MRKIAITPELSLKSQRDPPASASWFSSQTLRRTFSSSSSKPAVCKSTSISTSIPTFLRLNSQGDTVVAEEAPHYTKVNTIQNSTMAGGTECKRSPWTWLKEHSSFNNPGTNGQFYSNNHDVAGCDFSMGKNRFYQHPHHQPPQRKALLPTPILAWPPQMEHAQYVPVNHFAMQPPQSKCTQHNPWYAFSGSAQNPACQPTGSYNSYQRPSHTRGPFPNHKRHHKKNNYQSHNFKPLHETNPQCVQAGEISNLMQDMATILISSESAVDHDLSCSPPAQCGSQPMEHDMPDTKPTASERQGESAAQPCCQSPAVPTEDKSGTAQPMEINAVLSVSVSSNTSALRDSVKQEYHVNVLQHSSSVQEKESHITQGCDPQRIHASSSSNSHSRNIPVPSCVQARVTVTPDAMNSNDSKKKLSRSAKKRRKQQLQKCREGTIIQMYQQNKKQKTDDVPQSSSSKTQEHIDFVIDFSESDVSDVDPSLSTSPHMSGSPVTKFSLFISAAELPDDSDSDTYDSSDDDFSEEDAVDSSQKASSGSQWTPGLDSPFFIQIRCHSSANSPPSMHASMDKSCDEVPPSSQENQMLIKEVNSKWNDFYKKDYVTDCDIIPKIRFADPPSKLESVWCFSEEEDEDYRKARKGEWEQFGRDSERFKKRIQDVGAVIEFCLKSDHRCNIMQKMCELS